MPEFENGNMPDTLEFPCDPESLPTSSELPLGDLILQIKSISHEYSKENVDGTINPKTGQPKVGGKLMIKTQLAVAEPEELAGLPYTHRVVVGSDLDPKAKKEGTWRRNAVDLMAMFKHGKVGGKTFAERQAACVDALVGGSVKLEKSKDPQYADKHVVKGWWTPGTKPVHVQEANADLNSAFGRSATLPNHPTYANND